MQTLRVHSRKLSLILAVALLAGSAGLLAAPSAEELFSSARKQYDRHNYKDTVSLCEKALGADPAEGKLDDIRRLRVMALAKLRHRDTGGAFEKAVEEHPQLGKDPDLLAVVADYYARRWNIDEAYKTYVKAAELYEPDRPKPAADAWFHAAEQLIRRPNILPIPADAEKKTWSWHDHHRHAVGKAVEIYEHVLTLKVDDGRKAKALLKAGQVLMRFGEWKPAQEAIAKWRTCVETYGKTDSAPLAQYGIAQTMHRFSRYVEALKEYGTFLSLYPKHRNAKNARRQIAQIKAPQVTVSSNAPARPGDEVDLYWRVRNVRKVHLAAWKIDLTEVLAEGLWPVRDLFRAAAAVKGEQVGEWGFDTPDAGKHQYHTHHPPQPDAEQATVPIRFPVKAAGAYLVRATGTNPEGEEAETHCLVILSDISAVAKADADQVVVLATDVETGAPAEGAKVQVIRQYNWKNKRPVVDRASGKVDDGGLCTLKMARRRRHTWLAAVKKGDDQALLSRSGFYWSWWGYSNTYKVYGFTDRPVYRPKQTVHFKQIIRRHNEGTYANYPDKKVRVTITNPKGEKVYARDHVTDKYGAVTGSLTLGEQPPLGVYNIEVRMEGGRRLRSWAAQGNRFRVEEYKKPEFKVTVEPGQEDYRVGDEVKIRIEARYFFGQPVANAEVKFKVRKQSYNHRFHWPRPWEWLYRDVMYGRRYRPWWRPQFDELVTTGEVTTDDEGAAYVTVKAEPIKHHEELDLKFVVEAEVTDASRRVIRSSGSVKVTHAPFFIFAKPAHRVHKPGDSVKVNIKTEDPNKKPVKGTFQVQAWRVERIRKVEKKDGRETVTFEEKLAQKVFDKEVEVPETGRASVRFVPDMTGRFKVIVREVGAKEGRKPVEGEAELWVSNPAGAEAHYAYRDLELVSDTDQYEIGETMKVLVNTSKTNSRVLLTAEADDLLLVRVVHVARNSKLVEIPVTKRLCPNFTLTATLLRDGKLYMDGRKIVVPPTHRFLKVEATLDDGGDENTFQPRAKTKVRLKVTDRQTGKPVTGQVAVMMVDSSVYYIQPEFRREIEEAFYGFTRRARVATANSFAGPGAVNPGVGRPGRPGPYNRRRAALGRGAGQMMEQGAAPPAPTLAEAPAAADAAKAVNGLAMRKGAVEKQDAGPEQPELAEAVVRKEFRDTVLWAGSVVTDAAGRASIDVTFPDQLTTFALHAIAVDTDTRVGQTEVDVVTTKRIIARIQSGRFFTEGDHSYVTVLAHNYFKEPQTVEVDLTAKGGLVLRRVNVRGTWRDYTAGDAIELTVGAGGEERLDFLTTAETPGDVVLTARVRGRQESDAFQLTKPIVPWGAKKLVSEGDVFPGKKQTEAATFEVTVPEAIKPGSQELTVVLNPTVASVAMESLPFLAAYPYGCVEQTMSRFLPTVLMRKTVQQMGADLDAARKRIEQQAAADEKLAARWKLIRRRMRRNPVYNPDEVDRMIRAGLKRLAEHQHDDGSWGWWKHSPANAYMTAYVMYGLSIARDCDVKLPGDMYDRGMKWLIERAGQPKVPGDAPWWRRHLDNDNTRAYVLYVVSRGKPDALKQKKLAAHVDRLYEGRDDLTDYGRAYLALVLHAVGRRKEATIVVENFQNTVTVDEKVGSAWWGRRNGWWYWYHGSDETTAWVLQAMMTIDPDSKYVPMAVKSLVRNRRGVVWSNTKTTATVVCALARYAKLAGELDADQTYEVAVGGATHTVRVTRENLFTFDDRVVVPAGDLAPGRHEVTVRRKGKGSLYWSAHLSYFTTAERIAGGGSRIGVKRSYFRLVPEKFQNTRRVWKGGEWVEEKFLDLRHKREPLGFGAEIASGELVEVKLDITADNNFEYLLFEDPKPSGCEPYRLTSGRSYGGGTYANMELRDTRVVFFADWLGKGEHSLTYKLVCEQPGTFRVLPSSGEAMYSPFVEAVSDSGKIVITTKPEN